MSINIDCSSIIPPKTKQGCQENTIFNSKKTTSSKTALERLEEAALKASNSLDEFSKTLKELKPKTLKQSKSKYHR